MKKQDAGRKQLNDLAPKFAQLNDDVLFGEIWSREDKLSLKIRSIITISALMSKGIFDNSLKYHLENAKNNGVTKTEIVEIVTHLAFYIGWPNAWAVFPYIKEVYQNDNTEEFSPLFGLGKPNTNYEKYFIGKSYLNPLNIEKLGVYNVTFEPKCRNNWHIHHKGGQILLCCDGQGWYQEEGKKPLKLLPGSVVYIAPEIKHWHGANSSSWFSHISIEIPHPEAFNEWCEPVLDDYYNNLAKEEIK